MPAAAVGVMHVNIPPAVNVCHTAIAGTAAPIVVSVSTAGAHIYATNANIARDYGVRTIVVLRAHAIQTTAKPA